MLLGFPKADGTRRDSLKRSWDSLKKRNGIQDFQLKDPRFNHVLKSEFGFTTKEASAYLGHSLMSTKPTMTRFLKK